MGVYTHSASRAIYEQEIKKVGSNLTHSGSKAIYQQELAKASSQYTHSASKSVYEQELAKVTNKYTHSASKSVYEQELAKATKNNSTVSNAASTFTGGGGSSGTYSSGGSSGSNLTASSSDNSNSNNSSRSGSKASESGNGEAKPINNVLSNYDNEVVETESGSSGFASGLLETYKNGGAQGLVSNLTTSVSSYLNDKIQSLNKLASGFASGMLDKLGLSKYLDKFMEFGNKYFGDVMKMLGDMKNDALRQLQNAALNYISNIVEDLTANLLSTVYIPDSVFKLTIEGLYKAGADLAYNSHYLRDHCLARDWNETLKYVDEQYGLDYSPAYDELIADVETCSHGSCWKNLHYIFGKMYDHYKYIVKEIGKNTREVEKIIGGDISSLNEMTDEEFNTRFDDVTIAKIVALQGIIGDLTRNKTLIEETMVKGLKDLIVYSYTYVRASDIRKFFTDYPEILKPMYYGSTDNKYNQRFAFTGSDIEIMMPMHGDHKLTEADEAILNDVNSHINELSAAADEASKNATEYELRAKEAGFSLEDGYTIEGAKNKAAASISTLRKNVNQNQKDRYGTLSRTALTKGSNGVYKASMARYTMKNSKKDKVKYRSKDIDDVLEATMTYDNTWVDLRNKNIKTIYVLLANETIFGSEMMVNKAFYDRCKIPTATVLKTSLDKARGILGTSMLVQSMFDLSDAIDGSAYNYTKSVEDYLFDPSVNRSADSLAEVFGGAWKLTFEELNEPDIKDLKITGDLVEGEIVNPQDVASNHVVNNNTLEKINKMLDANLVAKRAIVNILRFASNIPMLNRRDIIIKWLYFFYNAMVSKGIDQAIRQRTLSSLVYYVFGKKGITDISEINGIFDYATTESLNDNIKVLAAISKLQLYEEAMRLEETEFKTTIIKLYKLAVDMMAREVEDIGFIKSLFKYDKEYLKTFFKASFYNEVDFLKSINSRDNLLYGIFYPHKDNLTEHFDGFDRTGIFGYSDSLKRIQFTNIIDGDWLSIAVTYNGTFFGGSDFAEKHGIKILDESTGTIVDTNITTGNWVSIFEYFKTTFFINSDDQLYYWNGSDVVYTGIDHISDWEFKTIKEISLILLCSKNNSGFKYFTNSRFNDGSTSGSGWKCQKIPGGHIVYPTKNPGYPYAITTSKAFKMLNGFDTYTHFANITHTMKQTVNPPQGATNPDGTPVKPTVTYTYTLYLFGGTRNNGILTYKSTSGSSNKFQFEKSNPETRFVDAVGSSSLAIPMNLTNTTICVVTDNKFVDVDFIISHASESTGGIAPVYPLDEDDSSTLRQFTSITKYQTCKSKVFFTDSTGSGNQNYYIDFGTSTVNDLDDSIDLNSGVFYEFDPNDTLYWKRNDGKGVYKFTNNSVVAMIDGADNDLTGWELTYAGGRLYATNTLTGKGVRTISGNKLVTTNIDSGFWKVGASDAKVFAMSYNNTNKGIRYCNRLAPTIEFIEIPAECTKYGDIGGFAYNSSRGIMYFGENRSALILNVGSIPYDVDGFIFPLYEYELQKRLSEIISNKLVIFSNIILSLLETNALLDDILNILNPIMDDMDDFYTSMLVSSNLFSNLLSYAEARSEFDIDDPYALDGILTDFILNYSYNKNRNDTTASFYASLVDRHGVSGSGPTNSSLEEIMARFNAGLINIKVFSNVTMAEKDGKMQEVSLLDSVGGDTTEFNKKYNWRTLEFMNCDENGDIY